MSGTTSVAYTSMVFRVTPRQDGDPLGRIVHDYGWYPKGSYSVNATHSCTSVKYLSVKDTVGILDRVKFFVKADLSSGYRQFGAHPVD